MNHHPSSRGFTLIELLVVIAIIGILSSVVLASLALARFKGADASVKSNMHTIQTQAEVYYSSNIANPNTYGPTFSCQPSAVTPPVNFGAQTNFFASDPTINGALKAAIAQGGQAYWAVGVSGASYAVEVSLKSTSNWWCIDASGSPSCEATGGSLGGGPGAAAACPTTALATSACN